jgi:hypothetical protein
MKNGTGDGSAPTWGRPPVCRFRETLSPGILQLACRASQNRQTGGLPRKTEAIFELEEKFLGKGTWEQSMLTNVSSLNTARFR